MEIKFSINNPKTGKTYHKVLDTNSFLGKGIKDTVTGEELGLPGYELQITGGSDTSGFPMRPDIPGHGRARPLLTGGIGIHLKRKGMRKRKTVVGKEVGTNTAQINLKIIKQGKQDIEELFAAKAESS